MNPEVSVIIVNFNTQADLVECIGSVYRRTKNCEIEIIVVDNASDTDPSPELTGKFPLVKVIRNEINHGFGAANNIGASLATGRYLFFLNPDTILMNDCIGMFHYFLTHQSGTGRTVCCGGNLMRTDHSPAPSWGNLPSLLQQVSDTGFSRLYRNYYRQHLAIANTCDFDEAHVVPYVIGADLFIDREIFIRTGRFNRLFFMYYEDADLLLQLKRAGYRAQILPQARIVHHESMSTRNADGFNYTKYGMLERSKYLYFRKNHGLLTAFLIKCLQVVTLAVHAPFQRFGYNTMKVIRITFAS